MSGLSCIRWGLLLGPAGSVEAAHGPSCPVAHRVLVPQPEPNPRALLGRQPPEHRGSPSSRVLLRWRLSMKFFRRLYWLLLRCAMLSRVRLFATPWTVVSQAPLSMGFPRQEYWSDLPFSFPGDFPNPGIEPASPALTGRFFTSWAAGKPLCIDYQPISILASLH